MLLDFNNTKIHIVCQQYVCTNIRFDRNLSEIWFDFKSTQKTEEVYCPYCGGNNAEIHDGGDIVLKDMPLYIGVPQFFKVWRHRYKCRCCLKRFSEDICFKDPDTRVTRRAAEFIRELCSYKVTTNSISKLTGIHWNTIRAIHSRVMNNELETHFNELKRSGYKPQCLAVDEFAIHKGQTYATCVMDLETGMVLWVGKGRSTKDFRKFFQEFNPDYLSEVKAIAMDMNAPYHIVVEECMPNAKIVYDRYHLQSLFSVEVLNPVRIYEAKKHKENAKDMRAFWKEETDPEFKKDWKQQYKEEREKYKSVMNTRWSILKNNRNLAEQEKDALESILANHKDLAVCYAMKEEMSRLYELTDVKEARTGWISWFKAAKESGIERLVHFANNKEKRIEGLISHAIYPISTCKLEGVNNKTKVAKRIAYGYRNDEYFFTLVKYMSIPKKT